MFVLSCGGSNARCSQTFSHFAQHEALSIVLHLILTFYQYPPTSLKHFSVRFVKSPWSVEISVLTLAHVLWVISVSRSCRTLCELSTLSGRPGMTGVCRCRWQVGCHISQPLKQWLHSLNMNQIKSLHFAYKFYCFNKVLWISKAFFSTKTLWRKNTCTRKM